MKEIMKLSFKAKSAYVEGLALEYNKALVALENEKGAKYLESLREDVSFYKISEEKLNGYKNYKKYIDDVLLKLSLEKRMFIVNDYISKKKPGWWEIMYSRSTYYRMRKNSIDEFLAYFIN